MRVLVCSGKASGGHSRVFEALDDLARKYDITAVIRATDGSLDHFVDVWARKRGYPVEVFRHSYREHGTMAPRVRDEQMFAKGDPDLAVLFPSAFRPETQEKLARIFGVPVVYVKAPKGKRA